MNIDYNVMGLYAGWRDGFYNHPFKGFVNPSNWTELQNSEFWKGYERGFVQGKADAEDADPAGQTVN